MKQMKTIIVLVSIVYVISMFGCAIDPVILHGDVEGTVTDSETNQAIIHARIDLVPSGDTAYTDSTGFYFLKNNTPGNYEIRASKPAYADETKIITVESADVVNVVFGLDGIPVAHVSDTLMDFGLDTDERSFTISNSGKGTLNYVIASIQEWITISPSNGDVTSETDSIKVTINRSGLTDSKYQAKINILYNAGEIQQQEEIDVYVNGVMDKNQNYYGTVTIGSQIWMAQNLNTGDYTFFHPDIELEDDNIIQKFCYDDEPANCAYYGGLYTWEEMMDYSPPDTGVIGITQGICPDGWHIPTWTEGVTLLEYLGYELEEWEYALAGGAMKSTGNIRDGTGDWAFPNTGATNISGFTGLPGGVIDANSSPRVLRFESKGNLAKFWISQKTHENIIEDPQYGYFVYLGFNHAESGIWYFTQPDCAASVRCIKDP